LDTYLLEIQDKVKQLQIEAAIRCKAAKQLQAEACIVLKRVNAMYAAPFSEKARRQHDKVARRQTVSQLCTETILLCEKSKCLLAETTAFHDPTA
jgi:response regulator RpfG family c-di-GMP phosphodiesterase